MLIKEYKRSESGCSLELFKLSFGKKITSYVSNYFSCFVAEYILQQCNCVGFFFLDEQYAISNLIHFSSNLLFSNEFNVNCETLFDCCLSKFSEVVLKVLVLG